MRKQIHPLILFSFLGIMMFILIINRPLNDNQSFKTKSNIAQIEAQALKHLDKPIIDLSGWQRPEEINYDALSQNISGAIVRVTELQKRNVPVAVYAYVAGKSVQEMEKAAEVFYNAASPYSPSYYWLDVEDKTMSNMNEGVENFRAKLASLGAKNIGIYVGVYFMEEHSIDTGKFTSVWIPSYGSDSGFFESSPKTDLDYDIHQYTSKGKIAGFDHDLDINVISPLKNKEETFRKLFLKP
ncbi:GH25 family lysozyme [Streptococcus pneumoniae]